MAYTQENRLIAINTPLGTDALLLQGFSGHDGISRLFNFQLDLLAERPVDFNAIVGQRVAIAMLLPDGDTRYFNGFVSRFASGGEDVRFVHYRAEVVPWLWFLTRTADCRIFQKLSVPDIVAKVFKDLGFNDFKVAVEGSFEPREYCVQYRETDFNFVSRLMEEEGIQYFFEHEKDKHTLVLANTPAANKPCPKQATARFEYVAGTREPEDFVTAFQIEEEIRPGKYALRDYNFETPLTTLEANVANVVTVTNSDKLEIYDYPGLFPKKAAGERLAKLRIEAEEAPHMVVTGASTCRAFSSGYRFTLDGYVREHDKPYVLTEVWHIASVGETYAVEGGAGGNGEESYTNQFVCIPHSVPFRPPRVTPKPTVLGTQTAVVAGKKGEEIWSDKYGRVKVQFHWDREGQHDENSSCWIRVAQTWAGKRWGAMFIPRIGQEVIVDYIDGDPDRPIIIGSVYNADQMPPYPLPDEQTKSVIKSNSSKGGGGFNELRLEDKKGKEQVFIHAERNHDNRVKLDSLEWIGNERHLTVDVDQLEQVQGDKHLHVKGDQNEKVDGTLSLEAGMDRQEKVGMKLGLQAGMEIHLKSGMNAVIESGLSLTLKVGANFVNINPVGIFIQGTMLMLNSPGPPAGNGSGASLAPPKDPLEADLAEPGAMVEPPPPGMVSAQTIALRNGARTAAPFCEKCAAMKAAAIEEELRAAGAQPRLSEAELLERARGPADPGAPLPIREEAAVLPQDWIEFLVVGKDGKPLAGQAYLVKLTDGSQEGGVTDATGLVRYDRIETGECEISFPSASLDGGGPAAAPAAAGGVAPASEAAAPLGPEDAPAVAQEWIEFEVLDEEGKPLVGQAFVVKLADGSQKTGVTDAAGLVRFDAIEGGICSISFPGSSTESVGTAVAESIPFLVDKG